MIGSDDTVIGVQTSIIRVAGCALPLSLRKDCCVKPLDRTSNGQPIGLELPIRRRRRPDHRSSAEITQVGRAAGGLLDIAARDYAL